MFSDDALIRIPGAPSRYGKNLWEALRPRGSCHESGWERLGHLTNSWWPETQVRLSSGERQKCCRVVVECGPPLQSNWTFMAAHWHDRVSRGDKVLPGPQVSPLGSGKILAPTRPKIQQRHFANSWHCSVLHQVLGRQDSQHIRWSRVSSQGCAEMMMHQDLEDVLGEINPRAGSRRKFRRKRRISGRYGVLDQGTERASLSVVVSAAFSRRLTGRPLFVVFRRVFSNNDLLPNRQLPNLLWA